MARSLTNQVLYVEVYDSMQITRAELSHLQWEILVPVDHSQASSTRSFLKLIRSKMYLLTIAYTGN